jgi:hypothetical protein
VSQQDQLLNDMFYCSTANNGFIGMVPFIFLVSEGILLGIEEHKMLVIFIVR